MSGAHRRQKSKWLMRNGSRARPAQLSFVVVAAHAGGRHDRRPGPASARAARRLARRFSCPAGCPRRARRG
eukprot:scaffold56013_cov67-Phaeocystis_antarctica.AAC.5